MNNLEKKKIIEELLDNFFDVFDMNLFRFFKTHSDGHFNKLLIESLEYRKTKSVDISSSDVTKWSADKDHGLVHSLITCLFAAFVSNLTDTDYNIEDAWNKVNISKLFYNCILHDFYRIYEVDRHDKKLRSLFPNCEEVVYHHSNPKEVFSNDPLIISDRVELLRFHNWKEWVDTDMLKLNPKIEDNWDIITFFYEHYRKKLQMVWDFRHVGWVHHHIEDIEKWDFPITRYPDASCFSEKNMWCINYINLVEQIIHSPMFCGILPIPLCSSGPIYLPREHLTLKFENINNIEDWVFVTDNMFDDDKNLSITEIKRKNNILKFIDSGYIPLSTKTTKKFINVCRTLENRLYLTLSCK